MHFVQVDGCNDLDNQNKTVNQVDMLHLHFHCVCVLCVCVCVCVCVCTYSFTVCVCVCVNVWCGCADSGYANSYPAAVTCRSKGVVNK